MSACDVWHGPRVHRFLSAAHFELTNDARAGRWGRPACSDAAGEASSSDEAQESLRPPTAYFPLNEGFGAALGGTGSGGKRFSGEMVGMVRLQRELLTLSASDHSCDKLSCRYLVAPRS